MQEFIPFHPGSIWWLLNLNLRSSFQVSVSEVCYDAMNRVHGDMQPRGSTKREDIPNTSRMPRSLLGRKNLHDTFEIGNEICMVLR